MKKIIFLWFLIIPGLAHGQAGIAYKLAGLKASDITPSSLVFTENNQSNVEYGPKTKIFGQEFSNLYKYHNDDEKNLLNMAKRYEAAADAYNRILQKKQDSTFSNDKIMAYNKFEDFSNFIGVDRANFDTYRERKKYLKKLSDESFTYFYEYRMRRKAVLVPSIGFNAALRSKLFYESQVTERENRILANTSISFPQKGYIGIYNELFKDYFSALRFGIGTVFTAKIPTDNSSTNLDTISTKVQATQRLVSGGGNVFLQIGLPLLVYKGGEDFKMLTSLMFKPNFDAPQQNTIVRDPGISAGTGIEQALFLNFINNTIYFGVTYQYQYIVGNAVFFDRLGSTSSNFRDGFNFNKLSVQLLIGENIRIAYNSFFGDGYIYQNLPSTISLTFVP